MSDFRKALEGLKQAREHSDSARGAASTRSARSAGPGPRLAPLPLHDTPKSKHPEYKAVKVFMRSENHRAAARKWRYENGGDFSDLVDELVERYLNT